VLACLKLGTQVTIDSVNRGWADGHIWWSVNGAQGWMAHDYLITE
jgi:hypothetical protein